MEIIEFVVSFSLKLAVILYKAIIIPESKTKNYVKAKMNGLVSVAYLGITVKPKN